MLEASLAHLVMCNNATRERRQPAKEPEAEALQLMAKLGSPRVDMVLFDGTGRDLLALVEFKAGYISSESQAGTTSDRDKLLRILPLADTCPYGIVCGWMKPDHWEFQQSRANGDRLYAVPFRVDREYFFGVRLFGNPSDAGVATS
jgi:hypothetical protein